MRRALASVVVVVLSAVSCGGDNGPTAPSPPLNANAAGVWRGTAQLTGVSGGGCLGSTLQAAVGTTTSATIAITQSGTNLTATTTDSTGNTCNYEGTVGGSAVILNATFCSDAIITGIQCSNGAVVDMRLTAASINGTVNGNTATGTTSESHNVTAAGTGAGVGILTATSTFTVTRQ